MIKLFLQQELLTLVTRKHLIISPILSKPNTIDGTAAKLLILISIKSVSLFFGANSSKYTAADKAIGNEINRQIKYSK